MSKTIDEYLDLVFLALSNSARFYDLRANLEELIRAQVKAARASTEPKPSTAGAEAGTRFACTFHVTGYGTSGTELPPPAVRHRYFTVLSQPGESDQGFAARMAVEGQAMRALLRRQFEADPVPYSAADDCDWSTTEVTTLTGATVSLTRGGGGER